MFILHNNHMKLIVELEKIAEKYGYDFKMKKAGIKMIKSILISIQPEHLVNILNGKKTLELRKTVPKNYKGWVYIYCTKNGDNLVYNGKSYQLEKGKKLDYDLNGKVVARFWFEEYEKITLQSISKNSKVCEYQSEKLSNYNLILKTCLQEHEMVYYLGAKNGYVWFIKNLEIFNTPKELSKFYKNDSKWSKHYKTWERLKDEALEKYILKRPPQNWQYIFNNKIGDENV